MSKRNGKRKDKVKILNQINKLDKRRNKEKDPETKEKMWSQREQLREKVKSFYNEERFINKKNFQPTSENFNIFQSIYKFCKFKIQF